MTKKQAIKDICTAYDSQVLVPMLGKGDVRQKLRAGLEKVLGRIIALESSSHEENRQMLDTSEPIDFVDMYNRTGNLALVNSIRKYGQIKTYADLLTQHNDGVSYRGESGLLRLRNLGNKRYKILCQYLAEKGIKL